MYEHQISFLCLKRMMFRYLEDPTRCSRPLLNSYARVAEYFGDNDMENIKRLIVTIPSIYSCLKNEYKYDDDVDFILECHRYACHIRKNKHKRRISFDHHNGEPDKRIRCC